MTRTDCVANIHIHMVVATKLGKTPKTFSSKNRVATTWPRPRMIQSRTRLDGSVERTDSPRALNFLFFSFFLKFFHKYVHGGMISNSRPLAWRHRW